MPMLNPISSFLPGSLFVINKAIRYDTIGLKVVTSTPPAPALPMLKPLKNKKLYNVISKDAIISVPIPFFAMDNGCRMISNNISRDKNVNANLNKEIFIGAAYSERILPDVQLSPQLNILITNPIMKRSFGESLLGIFWSCMQVQR